MLCELDEHLYAKDACLQEPIGAFEDEDAAIEEMERGMKIVSIIFRKILFQPPAYHC